MKRSLGTLIFTKSDFPVEIDYQQIKKAALVIRAFDHEIRYKILKIIDENERAYVKQIYKKLRIEQSVASQHLALLRSAGIVNSIRDGKTVYYSPNYNRINEIRQLLAKLI